MSAVDTPADTMTFTQKLFYALNIKNHAVVAMIHDGHLSATVESTGLKLRFENEHMSCSTYLLIKPAVITSILEGKLGASAMEVTRNVVIMGVWTLTKHEQFPYSAMTFPQIADSPMGEVTEDDPAIPPTKKDAPDVLAAKMFGPGKDGQTLAEAAAELDALDKSDDTSGDDWEYAGDDADGPGDEIPVDDTPAASDVPATPSQKAKWATSIPKTKPVKLILATQMYQPVKGSSEGSVYHLIAELVPDKGANVKVGARVKATPDGERYVSFRVESDQKTLAGLAPSLGALGMNVSGGYASVHVTVAPDMVERVLAAFTFGIGASVVMVVPKFATITGKGK